MSELSSDTVLRERDGRNKSRSRRGENIRGGTEGGHGHLLSRKDATHGIGMSLDAWLQPWMSVSPFGLLRSRRDGQESLGDKYREVVVTFPAPSVACVPLYIVQCKGVCSTARGRG